MTSTATFPQVSHDTWVVTGDGTYGVLHRDGTFTAYPDEAALRASSAHGGSRLVFTADQLAAQAALDAHPAKVVRGQYQSEPYPLLRDALAVLRTGNVGAAGRMVEEFIVETLGYRQYAGTWTGDDVKIARVRQDVRTKSGRLLVKGDLALAIIEPTLPGQPPEATLFSFRSVGGVLVGSYCYEILDPSSLR